MLPADSYESYTLWGSPKDLKDSEIVCLSGVQRQGHLRETADNLSETSRELCMLSFASL